MKPSQECPGFDPYVPLDRRDFLARFGTGLGGIALATLLGRESLLRAGTLSREGRLAFLRAGKRSGQLAYLCGFGGCPGYSDRRGEQLDERLFAGSPSRRFI